MNHEIIDNSFNEVILNKVLDQKIFFSPVLKYYNYSLEYSIIGSSSRTATVDEKYNGKTKESQNYQECKTVSYKTHH